MLKFIGYGFIFLLSLIVIGNTYDNDSAIDDDFEANGNQPATVEVVELPEDDPIVEDTVEQEDTVEADSSEEDSTDANEEESPEKAESEAVEDENEAPSDTIDFDITLDDELALRDGLNLLMEDVGLVEFDPNTSTYYIHPYEQEIATEVEYIKRGEEPVGQWYDIVYGVGEVSFSITQAVGAGYSLKMTNPNDSTEVIVHAEDGAVFWDISDDY